MFICMFCMGERRFGPLRFLWAAPILLLGYANALTYSRGGFLALVGGLGILILLRYGWLKTMLLAGLLLPVLLLASTGRQTEISTNTETAHDRILLWRDGLVELRHSPIFGTGMDTYPDITGGLVAHNSFIHAFIELGLVGGTLFVGLFYFSIVPLYRLESFKTQLQNPEFFRMARTSSRSLSVTRSGCYLPRVVTRCRRIS